MVLADHGVDHLVQFGRTSSFGEDLDGFAKDTGHVAAGFADAGCDFVDVDLAGCRVVGDLPQTGINDFYHTFCVIDADFVREPDPGTCFGQPDECFQLTGGDRYGFVGVDCNPAEALIVLHQDIKQFRLA